MATLNQIKALLIFICVIVIAGCSASQSEDKDFTIVCTTGMLTDAVIQLVDTQATVIGLMGPGVDPHLYKATQGDIQHLSNADVIVYNGLHLEGKMGEVFDKLKQRKIIITAADALEQNELLNNSDFQGAYDPHLWFDVQLWRKVVGHLGKELSSNDQLPAKEIDLNWKAYSDSLEKLNEWVTGKIKSIDSSKRILITAHDAFGYFGRAYDIEVRALQGISTQAEFGLKDVSELVNFISKKGIKAVFVESSVSERSLTAVVEGCREKGHKVKIGGSLFSDAMGSENKAEGTYLGMVRHNVNTIVKGLQ